MPLAATNEQNGNSVANILYMHAAQRQKYLGGSRGCTAGEKAQARLKNEIHAARERDCGMRRNEIRALPERNCAVAQQRSVF